MQGMDKKWNEYLERGNGIQKKAMRCINMQGMDKKWNEYLERGNGIQKKTMRKQNR